MRIVWTGFIIEATDKNVRNLVISKKKRCAYKVGCERSFVPRLPSKNQTINSVVPLGRMKIEIAKKVPY